MPIILGLHQLCSLRLSPSAFFSSLLTGLVWSHSTQLWKFSFSSLSYVSWPWKPLFLSHTVILNDNVYKVGPSHSHYPSTSFSNFLSVPIFVKGNINHINVKNGDPEANCNFCFFFFFFKYGFSLLSYQILQFLFYMPMFSTWIVQTISNLFSIGRLYWMLVSWVFLVATCHSSISHTGWLWNVLPGLVLERENHLTPGRRLAETICVDS